MRAPSNPCDACRAHGATSCSCLRQWYEAQQKPTGQRTRIIELHEAGKPAGQCPECGPHGNGGWVDLSVWRRHVVPCLACDARANAVGRDEGQRATAALEAEIRAEGCEPLDWAIEVDPLGDDPRARIVRVTVPYRHAHKLEVHVEASTDAARDAMAGLYRATVDAAKRAAATYNAKIGAP